MHHNFMRKTLFLAEEALSRGELPIAALVVLDGEIIAQATTAEKEEKRLLVHAELLALQMADKLSPFPGKRKNCILYTNLEPCLMCLGAAMSFFIGQIQYGVESPTDGATGPVSQWTPSSNQFTSYQLPQIEGGILREESIQLFQKYVATQPASGMRQWAESIATL